MASMLCLAIAPNVSVAQTTAGSSSLWIQIAESADSEATVQARRNSFEIAKNQSGVPIATITVQITLRSTSRLEYLKYYVTTADCSAGEGKLVAVSTTGAYKFENDFVSGGASVGSNIADIICGLYKGTLAKDAAKSL
jgi:hypothetical protein